MNMQEFNCTKDPVSVQAQVQEWALETFGKKTDMQQVIRGNKEMSELMAAIHGGKISSDKIVEECADVAFFLMQICEYHDADLIEEVVKKLEINRARSWGKLADGTFQHVE
jgi:NTP pyrophosphatase (non-canonical NTP hydrolase)